MVGGNTTLAEIKALEAKLKAQLKLKVRRGALGALAYTRALRSALTPPTPAPPPVRAAEPRRAGRQASPPGAAAQVRAAAAP